MILQTDGLPLLALTAREAYLLRPGMRRWRAEHEQAGARQKLTAVGHVLDEWERLADAYAARSLAGVGHRPSTTTAGQGNVGRELSTAEAAERLGQSQRTVRRLCATGNLTARQSGGAWRVDPASLEDYRRGRAA